MSDYRSIHVIQATRSFIKCMASLQYTVSPKPPGQSECKCSWWPHLETKSNVWSPSSIFVILVSVIMYIALYIAYSESQDFKHRCQVIDVNKYIFYPKKSEFSLRAGCVLSLFFLYVSNWSKWYFSWYFWLNKCAWLFCCGNSANSAILTKFRQTFCKPMWVRRDNSAPDG